ncbi:MAG TPA: AMP-binding protein [Candidatus Angelobacter sp.]|nr:AMP-binding protein [Candidatus Angelobacter sp.]
MLNLAQYALLHHSLGRETAFVYRRGLRALRVSYGQVAEMAFRFARELEARNIGKGDRVMLWGENCAEWVAAFFGCMLRGAVAVPMDRIAAADFAQRVAGDVDAKLMVCSGSLATHAEKLPHLVLENLGEVLAAHSSEPYPAAEVTRDDTAQIIFTSGTTAEPRGVVLTHGNILASVDPIENEIPKYRRYERIFHPIRFLEMLPLSHVFGQFMGMFIPPLIGGTVFFQDSFKPSDVISTIKLGRVSVLVAVPRVVESLKSRMEAEQGAAIQKHWAVAEKEKFLKRWWRFRKVHRALGWKFWAIISGGAALDQTTEEFWRRLGYVVIQGYGLTETSSLISLNHPFKVGRRSIGKVLPGREMKLDPESGEILVRGANVARQYWQGKEMKPVTGEEGWFRTGDLGEVDAEGNLYFKGRSKNVIVTPAGLKIYPEDLEQVLRRQPEVRDCVVFGTARGGNAEACAALLLRDNASGNEVIARANQSLADFQKIRCWLVWPEEDFPRTPTQKPKMDVIRQVAEAQLNGGRATAAPVRAAVASSGTLEELIQSFATRRAAAAGKPPGGDFAGARLEDDLNLSSLDRVELMAAIENRYQMELSDRDFSQATTVGDLEKLVRQSSTKSRQPDYPYARWAQRWPFTWIRVLVYHLVTLPYILLMARPRVIGREKLKGFRGPALVVSNHVTYIDVGFLMAALPFRLRARLATGMQGEMLREMRHPPADRFFLRRWLDMLDYALVAALFNVFSLPQRAKYRESFRFAGQLADQGYSVLIFPEGRRTETGEMSPFRSGIGLLATQLNLPVIPMRIDGLFSLKAAKKHFASPGTIQVCIGEPVSFAPSTDAEEIARELKKRVEDL